MFKKFVLLLVLVTLCLGKVCDYKPLPFNLNQIVDLNVRDEGYGQGYFQPNLSLGEEFTSFKLLEDFQIQISANSNQLRVKIQLYDESSSLIVRLYF